MNTLRILILTGTMEVGGIENQMMNLLRQADKSKYQIDFTTTAEHPYYEDEIKKLADLSYDDLAAACAKLSVEDVVARHTK